MKDITPLLLAAGWSGGEQGGRHAAQRSPAPLHGAGVPECLTPPALSWADRLAAVRGLTPEQHSDAFLERSEAFLERSESGESFRRSKRVPRVLARRRLAAEVVQHDQGLSNAAYLAATSGSQKITLTVTPARVRVSISDPLADLPLTGPPAGGGRRGVVREFSAGAADRLADRAAELQEMGKEPQVMMTLTSPGNWEEVYLYDPETGEARQGGRLFKQHLDAIRKRLDRKLQKMGIHHWSALWFLEFQERGAPHVHLILFDCDISTKQRAALRGWLGRAWAGVVGNPSKAEKQKHVKAGTQTAKMKKKHFGYAVKYAKKMEQKKVPEGFHGVGRFWGVWNCKKSNPIVLDLEYSRLDEQQREWVKRLALRVLQPIYEYSPDFFGSRFQRVHNALHKGIRHKQGFSVYGGEAARAALVEFA